MEIAASDGWKVRGWLLATNEKTFCKRKKFKGGGKKIYVFNLISLCIDQIVELVKICQNLILA